MRLGEEFHHNLLSLIASIGAWGAAPEGALWKPRRVMDTATWLFYTDRVSRTACSPADSRSSRHRTPTAGSTSTPGVKVALTYR